MAWGFTTDGERVLLDVCLGQRERIEDWLDLGRGLLRRGLRSPLLVVTDGAPGLIRAITELWPDADRQRCTVHRLRNVLAKLPERPGLHERVRAAYWAALDGATSPGRGRDGPARPRGRASSGSTPVPRPAWPRTCPPSPSISPTRSGSGGGCGRRTCWSGPSEEVRRRTKVIGRFPGETQLPDDGLGRHGPRHRRRQGARADPARAPRHRRHRRCPVRAADRPAGGLTYQRGGA